MQIGVIQFPGTNCERETMRAITRSGMQALSCLWNSPHDDLQSLDGYVIAGGFSYEDRSRAGIVAALDPLMTVLADESARGKPILGICNGAQILVESGLVPGISNQRLALALSDNKRMRDGKVLGLGYYNAWVHMRLADPYQRGAFTKHMNQESIMSLPVAHAEGRFIISDGLLREMIEQGLGVFQYCNQLGERLPDFPTNPNGSTHNLAGIANKAGNVLALMPHPERTLQGDVLFHSMRDYILAGSHVFTSQALYFEPRIPYPLEQPYACEPGASEYLVESIVTDNTALTMEMVLKQRGISASIRRFTHWECKADHVLPLAMLQETEVLYEPRKERLHLMQKHPLKMPHVHRFLVRAKEDVVAAASQYALSHEHGVKGILQLKHGVLVEVTVNDDDTERVLDAMLATNLLFNPYSQDCYYYV